ncbi:MAG: UvrD-helicase domain-containing protein [Gammaproteobacteria bacterium]
MSSANPLVACNPALNATVSASAGSGKTWLLITRIVRLLIDGAEPGNIIALTFTRKAAAEMQMRLNQRLYEMATAEEKKLNELLQLIGCDTETVTKTVAAGLYEKLMHSLYPIRIQTFHSFCQDILSRFPLEADIPPGFELLEDTSLLERQAWQTLFDKAGLDAQSNLNQQLDFIMQVCNGPDNTSTALRNFLSHRSDWWAYTAERQKPVDYACDELTNFLQIDTQYMDGKQDPIRLFFNDRNSQKLKIFTNLLLEIKNKTSEKHANSINQALKHDIDTHDIDTRAAFELVKSAFIKKDGEILAQGRKHSAALDKKLGAENAESFIELHHDIASNIQDVSEQLKRLLTLKINKAWYFAGFHYVKIFQQLKREMRLLDFTDLEWKCYQLLQHADNAHWVQYKIDQRIDHLLIDEFQDTNPTQWHLLSPILEEVAANPEQRPRSVFLVGDEKQSIYSFRRANPALQAQASQWLADNLFAKATPLDFSRRSSPAIIHCVNQVFEQDNVKAIMTGYTSHDTHLHSLPGRVQLCDLFEEEEQEDNPEALKPDNAVYFRNPLTQAREVSLKTLRHKEADYIARQILQLVSLPSLITDNETVRPASFGDVLILMRNRTHINIYEDALKQHGIPFIGNKKGGLLDNLEIQDLSCLLNTLITPYNNLALAQVLKSPLFNASDDDLILLAKQKNSTHWYERLLQLAADTAEVTDQTSLKTLLSKPLQRAAMLLPRWQKLAEQLPVHDCLDKIFSEGNIIKRYVAANKQENKQKVAANCLRFLELSLETDSGRYPSITRFLQRLSHLKNYSANPPQEPLSQSTASRVSLMTIHGSKGLEAPIVFLADCNSTSSNRNAYDSLVRWPANKSRPVSFQLQLSADNTDQITQKLQQEKLNEQAREELNLLYVALTRAREQLYISGIANNRNKASSWYQIIASGLEGFAQEETAIDGAGCKVYQHLDYDQTSINKPEAGNLSANNPFEIDKGEMDKRLLSPVKDFTTASFMIAPSQVTDEYKPGQAQTQNHSLDNTQDKTKWRGTIIHRVLEQLCNASTYPASEQTINTIQQQLKAETYLNEPAFSQYLADCIEEAVTVFNLTDFETIFNPAPDKQTYNEMPLMYLQGQQAVYGIIDRLIKSDEKIWIIDYKSHQLSQTESTQDAALSFSKQLNYYRDGIKKLWPEHRVETGLLFTRYKEIVWLE